MCGTKEGGTVCLPAEQRCTQCTEDEKKCFDSRGKDYCIPKLKACPKESLTLLCPKGTKICRQSQGRHFCELMDHDCPDLKAAEIKRLKSKLAKYKAQQIAPQGSAQMSIKDMFNSLRKDMPIVQKIPAASTFAPTNLAFNSKAVSKQMDALTNNLKMVQRKVLDQRRVLKFLSAKLNLAEKQIYQKDHSIRFVRDQLRREKEQERRENQEMKRLRKRASGEKKVDKEVENKLEQEEQKEEKVEEEVKEEEHSEEVKINRLEQQNLKLQQKEVREEKREAKQEKKAYKQEKVIQGDEKEIKTENHIVKKEKRMVKTEGASLHHLQGEVAVLEQGAHPSLPVMNSS